MKQSRVFVWLALAVGVTLSGASTLSAQDWRGSVPERRDMRTDYRGVVGDRHAVDRLRADIARDQRRLDDAIRRGRSRDAARFAADLARDQRALRLQFRDVRHDRADLFYDQRDAGAGYRGR
jgi:hypothetical protein